MSSVRVKEFSEVGEFALLLESSATLRVYKHNFGTVALVQRLHDGSLVASDSSATVPEEVFDEIIRLMRIP